MKAEALYRKLPVSLQHVACSVEGWRLRRKRYDADFRERLVRAEARLRLSDDEFTACRDAQLRRFVHHAATTVPYYRELFRRIGAQSGDFQTLDDLARLPVLTKAQVQQSPASFFSDAVPLRERVQLHTSGTTGAGLVFWTTQDALREQYAIWWRHLHRHGIGQDQWCAYFGGRSVVPVAQKKPPFWRINRPGRQVLFSAYHTGPENLSSYLREIRKWKFAWIHGYPSHIALLARHALESGFDLGYSLRWITTSSENLHAHQARLIRAAFGVEPIQNYGMTEAVANISQAPDGRLYVDEDFAAVEFVPLDGQNGACRVIGTNFSNMATPLLRYDTGDDIRLAGEIAGRTGTPGRVLDSIDGRHEDYVVLANGARIGRLDHIFKDLVNVREAQIRQSEIGAVAVLLVKGPAYTDADETRLLREFRTRLGPETRIDLRYVDGIEKTRSGKLRFVVSGLDARV